MTEGAVYLLKFVIRSCSCLKLFKSAYFLIIAPWGRDRPSGRGASDGAHPFDSRKVLAIHIARHEPERSKWFMVPPEGIEPPSLP